MVGEHADGFELFVAQQVGFVDDQDGGASAFVAFGGQDGRGLAVSRELERSGSLPKVATIISCRPRTPIMGLGR